MSISQLFILSKRGDIIFFRNFRHDIKKSNDIFFHKINFLKENEEDIPPLFNIDGINFIYRKTEYLYFVISTLDNFSANYYLEILEHIMVTISDHIGDLIEELIRKNFVLIYEIIDEMIDFGYPQLSDTEQIKQFVFTEPIPYYKNSNMEKIKEMITNSKSYTCGRIPIKDLETKNDLFVDILEKISCLFNRKGNIISSGIDGCIKMKSYLKNSPELRIVLSDDINIKKHTNDGKMELSGYNFCKGVRDKDFKSKRILHIVSHEGEFVLMNYRINNEFAPPFRLYTFIEESDYKLELKIKLEANFSNRYFAGNIIISLNAPKNTQKVYFDINKKYKDLQKVDYNENKQICTWKIHKIIGGNEANLSIIFTLQENKPSKSRKELGPISMSFEIPNYNISGLKISELKIITHDKNYNPMKWLRNITKSKSYVTRIA